MKAREKGFMMRGGAPCFLLWVALALTACGGGTPADAPQVNCPSSSPIGPASGSERVLFYKVTCDSAKPASLWALDPANMAAPTQIEPEFIPGSLQIVTDAAWDVGSRKIANREVRYLVYAKRDGRLYKVSALKKDALIPVPFSNETGAAVPGQEAPLLCSAFTLDDFADVENSLYYYTLAGPDRKCSTSDDNIQKIARLGMGTSNSPENNPVSIPNDRSGLIDYEAPLQPGVVPGATVPNRLGMLIDLIDKNNGGMIGWLAMIDRVAKVPPGLPFQVKNAAQGILETSPYEHGFSEGTVVQLSGGGLPGGLEENKNYFVHVTSPKTFRLYRTAKKIVEGEDGEDRIGFIGGTVLDPNGHVHPTPDDCAGDPTCEVIVKFTDSSGRMFDSRAECEEENASSDCKEASLSPPHVDLNMVPITSGGGGTIQRVTSYADLYRCDLNLADCKVVKQTKLVYLCKVSGDNQVGVIDSPLGQDFVVEAIDDSGSPASGLKITWRGGDKEGETCILFVCTPDAEDDIEPNESTTGGAGRTAVRGILRKNEGDTERNTNSYGAAVDGIGTPLTFLAGTAPQEKPASPSCKRREDFFISNITPLRDAKHGGLFSGKIVVRFDLLYKPDPGNAKPFLANQVKTKSDLYLYDIAGNQLSAGAEYTSKEAFPEGLPFVSDFDAAYFADRGTLYRLPFGGGLPFGNAQSLVSEGTQVAQLELTTHRVAYSLVEKKPDAAISTLKTIGKGGGLFATTLFGPTTDSLLPFMTGGENVYFQTLGPPKTPGVFGIASTIFFAKEDGSNPKTTENAVYAGRSEGKIFGISGCSNKKNTDLFIFPICAGGTLVSLDAVDPFSNQIALGTVPSDVMSLFFDGHGGSVLGEGETFKGSAEDPGESKGVDLFYVRGDQSDSLVRVTNTEGVYETFP